MNIAEVLTQFKRQNNVNNDYIADYCGVTKSTVSRWCTSKSKKVHPETLEKISQMLNIDLEDMTRVNGLAYEKPILGTVKAGYGLFAEENMEGYETVSESDFHKGRLLPSRNRQLDEGCQHPRWRPSLC